MKEQLLQAEGEDFVVFFEKVKDATYMWSGKVYPIIKFSDDTWQYTAENSSDCESDRDRARLWFEFSFCWRGVWEGRFYCKQEELWTEDLQTIATLWDKIELLLKAKIKADNPDYGCFDD